MVSLKTIRRLKKFLGFASPPHDGFADKYSIVTKENIQAVYAAPPLLFILYTPQDSLSSLFFNFFFANCVFLRRIVVFFTAYAFEKPINCETQQTATIATISANTPSEPKIATIFLFPVISAYRIVCKTIDT